MKVSLSISEDCLARLDRWAESRRVSRSAAVEWLLDIVEGVAVTQGLPLDFGEARGAPNRIMDTTGLVGEPGVPVRLSGRRRVDGAREILGLVEQRVGVVAVGVQGDEVAKVGDEEEARRNRDVFYANKSSSVNAPSKPVASWEDGLPVGRVVEPVDE